MFSKLFRRAEPPAPPQRKSGAERKPAAAPSAQARPSRTKPMPLVPEPPPVPEVREDHDESAWDLWEQSQFQLDSQLGALSPTNSVRVKDASPSQMGELDPFARIGKNDR